MSQFFDYVDNLPALEFWFWAVLWYFALCGLTIEVNYILNKK